MPKTRRNTQVTTEYDYKEAHSRLRTACEQVALPSLYYDNHVNISKSATILILKAIIVVNKNSDFQGLTMGSCEPMLETANVEAELIKGHPLPSRISEPTMDRHTVDGISYNIAKRFNTLGGLQRVPAEVSGTEDQTILFV